MADGKNCISCGEAIKATALICIHCQSFQDWRRYFSLGNTVITLVIALLSVASITIPVIKKSLTANNSDVNVTYLSSEAGKVNLFATNRGIRTGVVTSASMMINGIQYQISLNGGAFLVEQGVSKKIVLDTAEVSKIFYTQLEPAAENIGGATRDDICSLSIEIRSFLDENKSVVLSRRCAEFLVM